MSSLSSLSLPEELKGLPNNFEEFDKQHESLKMVLDTDVCPILNSRLIDEKQYPQYRRMVFGYWIYGRCPESTNIRSGMLMLKPTGAGTIELNNKIDKLRAQICSHKLIDKLVSNPISDFVIELALTTHTQRYRSESLQMTCVFLKEIIADFTDEERRHFLRWCTAKGFVDGEIAIELPFDQVRSQLPMAFTCGSTIQLLPYTTRDALEKDLRCSLKYRDEQMFGDLSAATFTGRQR